MSRRNCHRRIATSIQIAESVAGIIPAVTDMTDLVRGLGLQVI